MMPFGNFVTDWRVGREKKEELNVYFQKTKTENALAPGFNLFFLHTLSLSLSLFLYTLVQPFEKGAT